MADSEYVRKLKELAMAGKLSEEGGIDKIAEQQALSDLDSRTNAELMAMAEAKAKPRSKAKKAVVVPVPVETPVPVLAQPDAEFLAAQNNVGVVPAPTPEVIPVPVDPRVRGQATPIPAALPPQSAAALTQSGKTGMVYPSWGSLVPDWLGRIFNAAKNEQPNRTEFVDMANYGKK